MSVTTEEQTTTPPAGKNKRRGPNRPWAALLIALAMIGLSVFVIISGNGTTGTTTTITPTPVTNNRESPTVSTPTLLKINELDADPKNPATLYLSTGSGLKLSKDSGKTWQDGPDPLKNLKVLSLAFDSNDLTVYAATDGKGLFKSGDGGKTWQSSGLENRRLVKVIARNNQVLVAVNGPLNGVYRSADSGKTWSVSSAASLPENAVITNLSFDPSKVSTLYMTTAFVENRTSEDWSRVKVSEDGGFNWRELGHWSQDTQVPDPRGVQTVLLSAMGARIYAGDGEALYRITPDRESWVLAGGGLPDKGVYGVVTDPQRPGVIYAATRSGIYRNSDGLRWIKMADGDITPVQFGDSGGAVSRGSVFIAVSSQNRDVITGLTSTILYAITADGKLVRYENQDFGSGIYASILGEGVVQADFSLYGGVNPAARVNPPNPGTTDSNRSYFNETGHYLTGGFKNFWERNGNGLAYYGFPITEEFSEFDPEQNVRRTVQYFERAKLEYLPNQLPGNEIQVALLGKEATSGQFIVPARFEATTALVRYFDATQHTIRGEIKKYWDNNNGLSRFGYPLTEEQEEKTSGGKTIVVQYFERVKLQYVDGKVQIALLGTEVMQKRGWLPKS